MENNQIKNTTKFCVSFLRCASSTVMVDVEANQIIEIVQMAITRVAPNF